MPHRCRCRRLHRWQNQSCDQEGVGGQTAIESKRDQPRAHTRGEDALSVPARLIHRRTEGNPLFVVAMVDDLITQGIVVQSATGWELKEDTITLESRIPDTIRQLVALQSHRLSPAEQHTLEAASIAGLEFSAAAVAAALGTDTLVTERQCEHLAQQHVLRRLGVADWPDGTLAARYGFRHAVYQQVWHERVSPTQLQHYHRRIGERKERAYGEQAREVAAELAIHFEQGREYAKAVGYLYQAGKRALQHSAYREALGHLTKALELLKTFADNPKWRQMELKSQISLGVALMATKGYAAPEAKQAYDRARELCQQIGQTLQLVPVLRGLAAFYYVRAELATARELGEQLLRLVQEKNDQALLLEAHQELGGTLSTMGEFSSALQHLEQGIHLYDPKSIVIMLGSMGRTLACRACAAPLKYSGA